MVADDKDLATIKFEVQKMLGLRGAVTQGLTIKTDKEDSRKAKLLIPYMIEHGKKKSASTYDSICYTFSVMRKFDANADQLTFEDLNYSWLTDCELYQ